MTASAARQVDLKPVVIKILKNPKAVQGLPDTYSGFIVPDTDGIMAIDMRHAAEPELEEPADWIVTHLPTGAGIVKSPYTAAHTCADAVDIAQRFYREAMARGWPLESADTAAIVAPHNAMTYQQKLKFWHSVAGFRS